MRWAARNSALVLIFALANCAHAQTPPAACEQYRALFSEYYDAPSAAVYVGQVWQESACVSDAISPAGARGLAQFMQGTANDAAARNAGLRPPAPFSPEWSVRAQVWYMRLQKKRLRGDSECDDYAMALAAYNSGAGWVLRAKKRAAREGKNPYLWWGNVEVKPDRRHARAAVRENRDYVHRILRRNAPAAARAWHLPPPPCAKSGTPILDLLE